MTNLFTCPTSSQNGAAVDDQIGLVLRVLGNLQLTGHSRTYRRFMIAASGHVR